MYINKTYQDYLEASDKLVFILSCINDYKSTNEYKIACKAEQYLFGDTDILRRKNKTVMTKGNRYDPVTQTEYPEAYEVDITSNRVSNNFIFRFVTQASQYLMNNGLDMQEDRKKELGDKVDDVLQKAVEKAYLQGEGILFWNADHIELFQIATANQLNGMFFLLDEVTSKFKIGVRFWQISDKKPLYFSVYDDVGISTYTKAKDGKISKISTETYIVKKTVSAFGETVEPVNIGYLPFVILKGNESGQSILTHNVKSKIDLYDTIISDYGDNMERLEGVYWAIKNFSGTSEQARCMLADMEKYKIAVDNGDTSASPQAIEAPFQARNYALTLLERALYQDTMSLNLNEITGGSLTNVAINIAKTNLETKCNMLEYQLFNAIYQLLEMIGKIELYPLMRNYERMNITNKSEIVRDIYIMRNDITRKKALDLNPYINNDEIEEILQDLETEELGIIEDGQGNTAM